MCKRFYILILTALTLAACAKEGTVRDVAVQFDATVSPEMTVLVKSGETQPEPVIANHAVLQAWRGDKMAAQAEQNIEPGTTQISFSGIRLTGGAEYLIYIWVDCEGYYDTSDLRSVSVAKNYDGKSAEFDAFYSCSTVICGQDDVMHNVTLKRPFAKVSFSAQTASQLNVKFSAPNTLDLTTGKVSGNVNVNYTITPDPEASGVTAFDYVFADEGLSQMSYTFKLGEEEESTATVPIARNTKTNIIYNITN